MASSLQPNLKILQLSNLTPQLKSLPPLPFTFYDIVWLYGGSVQRIFFFPIPSISTSHFLTNIVPHLQSSLSKALDTFYPLYGKIRKSPGTHDKFELSYKDGDSVPLIVAQLDGEDLHDLSGHHARQVKRLLTLCPDLTQTQPEPESDDGSKPVLAIQVTLLPDQGLAIGLTAHHAACDGHASMRFVSTWASISRAEVAPVSPVFDRTIVSDPMDLYSKYLKTLSSLDLTRVPPPPSLDDLVIRTFALTRAQIQGLKDAVAQLRCSTTVVTYALAWVCLVRARRVPADQTAHFAFAANCSHGQDPPIPPDYFGNRIGAVFLELSAGELYREEGFVVGCRAISESVKRFKEGPLNGADGWMDKFVSIASAKPFSVAGSPQLKVYDVDFGFGKARKVEVISIVWTGAMSMAESRDEQGGVEIGLALDREEMDEFATQIGRELEILCGEKDR